MLFIVTNVIYCYRCYLLLQMLFIVTNVLQIVTNVIYCYKCSLLLQMLFTVTSVIYFYRCYLLLQMLFIVTEVIYCYRCYLLLQMLFIVTDVLYCYNCYLLLQMLFIVTNVIYCYKCYLFFTHFHVYYHVHVYQILPFTLGTLKKSISGKYKCIARGNPAPTLTWTFNGQRVRYFFDSYHVSSDTEADKNKVSSSLVVMSTKSSGGGDLKCMVINNLGSDSATLRIQIKGKKDVIC